MGNLKSLVDRFLSWPLPKSVAADTCAIDPAYPHPRSGTNLLTASEAEEMFNYVLEGYDDWDAEYFVKLKEENERLRDWASSALRALDRGLELMPDHHLDQWEGVRGVLETYPIQKGPADEAKG